MTPSPVIQKELLTQLVKWGFMTIVALMGVGLVSVANRNVYTKPEVDYKDAAIRAEVQRVSDVQAAHNYQVIKALDELKSEVRDLKERQ